VAQACAEVLPEGRSRTGIVRREEQGEHEEEAAETCGTHHDAEEEGEANRQFAIGYQEGDACAVWKDKAAENGRHERVNASLEEFVDPELKAAVKCECRAKNFVLAEDQEKNTNADAEQGERIAVTSAGIWRKSHRDYRSMTEFPLQLNSYEE